MAPSPADALALGIARTGARHAFGVPGGGPNLDLVGAFGEQGIDFILGHHETATAIMATTYGWLTNTVTAAVVTRGPGAAAAVNGAAQATLDRQPLLLVTDTVPAADRERVAHQRIDQRAMLIPVTKAGSTLTASATLGDIEQATTIAAAEPAGAVHLDYDASADLTTLTAGTGQLPVAAPRPQRSALVERARLGDALRGAQRPIVIVGAGAIGASAELRPLLEKLGAPVLTTYQAIGVIPTEHQLAAGLFTNGAAERPLLQHADLILAIGLDMVEPIPKSWAYTAPVIAIAETPTFEPYMPLAAEVVGPIGQRTAALLDVIEHTWPADIGQQHRTHVRHQLAQHGQTGFGPMELVATASAHCPPNATVTVDAGAHFLAIMPVWPVAAPKQLLISNGLATMGYAVPAAIGAAFARPGQPVVALVGDGGLGMTLAELETIARYNLPITTIVFNDAALSLIEIKQGPDHGGPAAVKYLPTDYAKVAVAHGVAATAATSADELAAALAGHDFASPHLIDARIDPAAYRHVMTVTRG